jgi:hypothetical protein
MHVGLYTKLKCLNICLSLHPWSWARDSEQILTGRSQKEGVEGILLLWRKKKFISNMYQFFQMH